MIIVEQTFNVPQTPMCKGFEACHVNRLIDFCARLIKEVPGICSYGILLNHFEMAQCIQYSVIIHRGCDIICLLLQVVNGITHSYTDARL